MKKRKCSGTTRGEAPPITKEELIEHMEWTRASCQANLEQMFKWLLRLEERMRMLEEGEK